MLFNFGCLNEKLIGKIKKLIFKVSLHEMRIALPVIPNVPRHLELLKLFGEGDALKLKCYSTLNSGTTRWQKKANF
jgi:hypothetical protein